MCVKKCKIALTGGIGTGKTYLSRHFVEMGIPVFYADVEAKKLYQDADFVAELSRTFNNVLLPDGTVDLRKMGAIVFADEEKLQTLNKMIHPRVMQMFEEWAARQSSPTVIMETAIVYEGNLTGYFDKIIVADAPLELRIRRILQRDPHLTREEVLQRMARQMPQEEKCSRADLVICTGETYREALVVSRTIPSTSSR